MCLLSRLFGSWENYGNSVSFLLFWHPTENFKRKFAVGMIDYYINFSLFWVWSRNNAGKFAHQHAISEDGIEMTFATNYRGKYC